MAISIRIAGYALAQTVLWVGLLAAQPALAENPFQTTGQKLGAAQKQPVQKPNAFIIKYDTPKKEVYRDIQIIFKSSGVFENIARGMNEEFVFPKSTIVRFTQGDGPLYIPEDNTIKMSYEFVFYLSTLYLKRYPKATDDDMMDFSLRSTTFLFYHEMAHALIDMYQIPMVSNEETAADNLAVILALEVSSDGFKIVMDSAELFDLLDSDSAIKYDESDYWDEHALDAQRFYNILCMAYGKSPKKVMQRLKVVDNKKLFMFIKERGEYCKYQYDQQLTTWAKLLAPHFRH